MGQNYTIFADARCMEIKHGAGQPITVFIDKREKLFSGIDELKKYLPQLVNDFESGKTGKLILMRSGNDGLILKNFFDDVFRIPFGDSGAAFFGGIFV